jgi:hypothetical protein
MDVDGARSIAFLIIHAVCFVVVHQGVDVGLCAKVLGVL